MPRARTYYVYRDWSTTFDPTAPPGPGSIRGVPRRDLRDDTPGSDSETGSNSDSDSVDPDLEYSSEESDSDSMDEGSEYEPSDYDISDDEDDASSDLEATLNEPLLITFKRGDNVWIKMQGKWYYGRVLKELRTAKRPQVVMYSVFFRGNLKANLAPIDGTIKPDTPRICSLLRAGKWI